MVEGPVRRDAELETGYLGLAQVDSEHSPGRSSEHREGVVAGGGDR